MKQGMYDKSTAGGENTGEIQFAVFYLAEKRSLAMSYSVCWLLEHLYLFRLVT